MTVPMKYTLAMHCPQLVRFLREGNPYIANRFGRPNQRRVTVNE